jgi:hypothetical protein
MTHSTVIALVLSSLVATPALADSRPLEPYADYVTYVTTFRARTTGDRALAIAQADPAGARCFASAPGRSDRELCQRYLQEKALIDAMPAIAIAARAKLILDANPDEPSRSAMLPIGLACVDAADRLAETGIAPLRKVGPYTIGLLKSKLCNALLVATDEGGTERVSATAH